MLSVEPNERITFGVRYQDDDLLVIEKPARVPTQPGKGHQTDTLLNGLFAAHGQALQNLGASRDYGLLHRLDRDTSGLLIVGLRTRAYDRLREMFVERAVKKFYWAVCDGRPRTTEGVIRLNLAETGGGEDGKPSAPKRAHISSSGKPAITAYRVLEQSEIGCLIEARPVTGRLHQVRVHLNAIGCPILGDTFYGPRRVHTASHRLALHAHRLVFEQPTTGALIDVKTDWPGDLARVLKSVGLKRPSDRNTGGGEAE